MQRSTQHQPDTRTEQRPAPQPDIIQNFLFNPVVIITILTAVLYFHGQALYSGYLSYWGLDTQTFPLPFEETLTHGAWTYLFLGVDKWQYLAMLALFFLASYGVAFLVAFKRPMSFVLTIIGTKKINDVQKKVVTEITDRFLLFNLVLVFVLVVFLTSIWSVQKGKALAEANHENIHADTEAHKPFKSVTISYMGEKNEPTSATGTLIQSSSSMFALHTDNDDVLLVPASRVISIRHLGENWQADNK
jgi:hypothetical protein